MYGSNRDEKGEHSTRQISEQQKLLHTEHLAQLACRKLDHQVAPEEGTENLASSTQVPVQSLKYFPFPLLSSDLLNCLQVYYGTLIIVGTL